MSINYVCDYNREIRGWLLLVFDYARTLPKNKLINRDCPVCGSSDSSFFAHNDFLDYEKCSSCALVFMNPAIPANLVEQGFTGDDEILMDYFKIIMKYKSALPSRPDPMADNKLRDIYKLKSSGRLLDVGCSIGEFLHRAKFFYDVEGVEVNPHTSAIAEKHFKIHKQVLSSLKLDKGYDIVTLHQILYGVPDPVGLLRDIHDVLKDDGLLYINTANADSYAMKMYGGKASHLYGYTTLYVFSHQSLCRLAELSGFEVKFFRTEWLDIYLTDLIEYYEHPKQFIHKKNCQIENYEKKIQREDELQRLQNSELGMHGNYLVAILEKKPADVLS